MLGEIFLYDKEDEIIFQKTYDTVKERQVITAHLEAIKDHSDYIQIHPVANARQLSSQKYSNLPLYSYESRKNGHGK